MPKIEVGSIPLVTSGTTTATTASKLVDSTQNFLSTVSVGDLVRNTTDTTVALITAIDSDTTLSIDTDIFIITENYVIENRLPAQSFLIDSIPFQRGAYEPVIDGTLIGINRINAPRTATAILVDPVIFSDWTDSVDAPFASVAAFVAAVEQFFFKS